VPHPGDSAVQVRPLLVQDVSLLMVQLLPVPEGGSTSQVYSGTGVTAQ
jgi:hypothetical protein